MDVATTCLSPVDWEWITKKSRMQVIGKCWTRYQKQRRPVEYTCTVDANRGAEGRAESHGNALRLHCSGLPRAPMGNYVSKPN